MPEQESNQANNPVILGIHSNVPPEGSSPDGSANSLDEFAAGHAWISVTQNGVTTRYGLWPDGHPDVEDNGEDTDIRVNLESDDGVSSRYFQLSDDQAAKLQGMLGQDIEWGYLNNCSSWASEVVNEVTSVDVDADDYFGIETPRELSRSIDEMESRDPTSRTSPKVIEQNSSSLKTSSINDLQNLDLNMAENWRQDHGINPDEELNQGPALG